jgi:peptidoglycan/LPS O-acetylase OafA/YrhL
MAERRQQAVWNRTTSFHSRTMDHQRNTQGFLASALRSHRPDIDGLRAVAVWLVVLYHAWPHWLKSGFIGVDIFFVISGFLITSIILHDLDRGSFSLREFYIRRVRRIFPALLVVVFVTLSFGWYVLLQHEFAQLGKHISAAATFLSNLVLWKESGYFDNDHTTKPLLHFWSLGVEEQFYLVWPLMLALFSLLRAGILFFLAMTLAASFLYGLESIATAPAEAYFSPVTRFWELAAGGLVAHVLSATNPAIPVRRLLSAMGLLLLLLGALFIDTQRAFPGAWALLPVAGTCALIIAGSECWVNKRLLGNPWMARMGLISYPFYLWHWPLISFAYIVIGEKPSPATKLMLVLGALLLAFLTFRFIERPIQRAPKRTGAVKSLLCSMACLGALGALVHHGVIRERIETNGAERYLRALNDVGFPDPAMTRLQYHGSLFQQLSGQGEGVTVLLGDSLMEQYAPLVADGLSKRRFNRKAVIFATAGGCPPIKGAVRLPMIRYPTCSQTVDNGYLLAASREVDTVVIAASWHGYFSPSQRDLVMQVDGDREQFPAKRAQEMAWVSLQQSIQKLRDLDKRVFLILQPPSGDLFDPRSMITGSRFGEMKPRTVMESFRIDTFHRRYSAQRDRLLGIARLTGALVVDPVDTICANGTCSPLNAAGEPIYTDPVHMRPYFVRTAIHYLDDALSSPPASAAGHSERKNLTVR